MGCEEACPSLSGPQGSSYGHQPETARHPDGHDIDMAFNTTPERDDEGERGRVSSEASRELQASAASSAGGEPSSSSGSAADSANSNATHAAVFAHDPSPVIHYADAIVRSYLVTWGQRLLQLQPKVYLTDHLIDCGLYLFKYLRHLQLQACYEGRFPYQYLSNEQFFVHELVACWWIALKHCSVRTAVPNRTLMCRATNASAELLSDREIGVLEAIDWDVQAVLKQGGLVQ